MEDFLPVVGFIAYIAYQIYSAAKSRKSGNDSGEYPKPSTGNDGKGFFEQLEETIRTFEQKPKEQTMGMEPIEGEFQSPKDEYVPLSDQIELTQYKPISAEILEAPYSNLEEGILDEVHLSKLPHDGKSTVAKVTRKKRHNRFKNFDPEQAFVYSLIFERKYFDV